MGSPSWEAESPVAIIFALFDIAKWVSSVGAGYLLAKIAFKGRYDWCGLVGKQKYHHLQSSSCMVWAGCGPERRKPGALREGRNICSGDSFKSAPSSLDGSKFHCEVILLHFPSTSSSPPPFHGSNANTWSLEQGSLVRLEESIRRGRGWCQWPPAKDHKDRPGARVRKEAPKI